MNCQKKCYSEMAECFLSVCFCCEYVYKLPNSIKKIAFRNNLHIL